MINQRLYHLGYVNVIILCIVALAMTQTAHYWFAAYQRAYHQHEANNTLSFLVGDLLAYFSRHKLSDTKMLRQSVLYTLSHERTRVTNVRIFDDTHLFLWSLYPTSLADTQNSVSNMAFVTQGHVLHVHVSYLLDPVRLDNNWFVLLMVVVVLSFVLYEMLRALLYSDLLLGLWAENETALRWMQGDFSKIMSVPHTMGDKSSRKQLVSAQGINETYAHLSRRYQSLLNSETDHAHAEEMCAVFEEAKGNNVFLSDKPSLFFVWGCNAEGRWLVLLSSFLAISMFFGIRSAYFSFSILVSFLGWTTGLLAGCYTGQYVSKRLLLTLVHVIFAYSMILYLVSIFHPHSYQFFPAVSWLAVGVLSSIFMVPPNKASVLVPPHEKTGCPIFAIWCGLVTLSPVVNYFIHVGAVYERYEMVWVQSMYAGMVWLVLLFYSWFFAKRHPAWGSVSHREKLHSRQQHDILLPTLSFTAGLSICFALFVLLFQQDRVSLGVAASVVGTCVVIQRVAMGYLLSVSLCLFLWVKVLDGVFGLHWYGAVAVVFIPVMGTLVMYLLSQAEQQCHLWHPVNFFAFFLGMFFFYLFHRYGWTDVSLLGVYFLNDVVFIGHRKQVCAPG